MEKYYIFDEEGSRYEVENMRGMIDELDEDGFEMIYKPTRYFDHFNKFLMSLIEAGALQQVEGETYDHEGVARSMRLLEAAIADQMGVETLDAWCADVDLQWEANKPRNN